MIKVEVTTKPLTENGLRAITEAYNEDLTQGEKQFIKEKNIEFEKEFFENPLRLVVRYVFQGKVTDVDILRERIQHINKKLFAGKGAWETDYESEVRVWQMES